MNKLTITALLLMSLVLHGAETTNSVLTGTATSIDGTEINLADYHGKVVLVVNVASRCGFTPQYEHLQQVYTTYADQGFVVLGFPCNQFRQQEPGTNAAIKQFCQQRFGVTFPLFAKIEVNGDQAHPLYRTLTSPELPISDTGPIKWNFEKFLISRNGQVLARYRSRTAPNAAEVIAAIEEALQDNNK